MGARLPEDLSERCFKFSCDVYDYCQPLVQLGELPRRLAYQLFDAAGSVGANRAESKSAYSRKEFRSKNAICLKESREANFWLRLAEVKSLGDPVRRKRLLQESSELVAIFVTSVRNLKKAKDGSDGQFGLLTSDFRLLTSDF
jgi:four helix bundle protein